MIDSEIKWEEIRLGTNLEKITPEKFTAAWQKAIGNNKTVVREKFISNQGEQLKENESKVLEGVKVISGEDITMICWKDGGMSKYLPVDNETFFMGIQEHEGGEKSFILTHNSIDKNSGKEKQTVRRFTAAKMQTATV